VPLVVLLVATVLGLLLVARSARAALTLCVAEVRDGKIEVTRGGVAPRVLADLADVVARPPVGRATLRIVRARGLAEVQILGALSAAQAQQVRNVVGSVPLAALGNARRRR
jgi:hypothetical protein